MIIEESVRFMLCEPIFFLQLFLCGIHGISEFLKSVGFVGLADKNMLSPTKIDSLSVRRTVKEFP